MVLSFKRLTLENWYPKEFCEKLKSMNKLDIVNKIRDFELEEGELFFQK